MHEYDSRQHQHDARNLDPGEPFLEQGPGASAPGHRSVEDRAESDQAKACKRGAHRGEGEMRRKIQADGDKRKAGGSEHHDSQKTQGDANGHGSTIEICSPETYERGIEFEARFSWSGNRRRLGQPTGKNNLLTGRALRAFPAAEQRSSRHRLHRWALAAPFIVFPLLYLFPWNPIYPAITAMVLGAITAILCRPDLARKTWVGALLFLGYYTLFLLGLEWTAPGYIERVWNLAALSGLSVGGFPIEELLFATAFGGYWAGVYDHFTWQKILA